MKKIFRDKDNQSYWEDRWQSAGLDQSAFRNMDIYPIRYAELVAQSAVDILEAGCGGGRLYFHYKEQGKNIRGFDSSKVAIANILKKDPSADVLCASITNLPYEDEAFDALFAFGLFHNIEDKNELKNAFSETRRVMRHGGLIVASVRLDSIENNFIEWIVRRRSKSEKFEKFHRWHFDIEDLKRLFGEQVEIQEVHYGRNVSFLFKFDLFRSFSMKSTNFQETAARSEGFSLNWPGRVIDRILHAVFPKSFSNLMIVIARKK